MAKISVIIPVYNTEQYLRRCLESVVNQTMQDIEIICVDDGSTDGSPQILEEYRLRDSRVKVIRKENGGLVSARKTGVENAEGEYVGYVDSDDWIEPDMYEALYKEAYNGRADLVSCGYFLEGAYTTVHMDTVDSGLYSGEKMKYLRENTIYRLDRKETGLRASLCNKLFSGRLIKKIQCAIPNDLTIAEDKMCLLTYILECDSVMVLNKAYYHYCIHAQSMTHEPDEEYLIRVNSVYQYLISLYENPDFTEKMRIQSELYITEMLLSGINSRLGFKIRNLLWFDPYWLDRIPDGARVVLYGAGEAGEKCRRQLASRDNLHYVGCVDFGYERACNGDFHAEPPSMLEKWSYDYIVITIKNAGKAKQVKAKLEELGIAPKKILWFEQKELFWRYAEAEGLLKEPERME